MDREIEFRAWHNGGGDPRITPYMRFSEPFVIKFWESVKNETLDVVLMQYTGLKDINGKKIYEGDILSEKWKAEVYSDSKTGCYMIKFHNNPKDNKPQILYDYIIRRVIAGTSDRDNVVIGNIFENPELLEVVK